MDGYYLSFYISPSTAFNVQLQSNLLSFDLDGAVSSLESVRDRVPAIATDTQAIIDQLVAINNTLPSIEMNVDLLSSQVDELSTHIDTVVVSTCMTLLQFTC